MRRNESVIKAVALLHAAADHPDGLTVSELARAADMPRVTAGRIAATLLDFRLLQRQPGGSRIVLGSEVVRLGRLANVESVLIAAVSEHAEALREQFRETVTVTVCRGDSLEVIYQLDSSYAIIANWIGREFPLHASAAGKVFLAFSKSAFETLSDPLPAFTDRTITSLDEFAAELEAIRSVGYAITESEFEEGLGGVSVPIFGHVPPDLLGILSVTAPSSRMSGRDLVECVEALMGAAAKTRESL